MKEMNASTIGSSRRAFLQAAAGGAVLAATVDTRAAAEAAATDAALAGRMVEYKSGDLMIPAYFSSTPKKGRAAVLVIHEVFGLNDHIKSIADRIAGSGYNALAPNLFVRAPEVPPKDTSDTDRLRRAAGSIPLDAAIKDMQAGLDYLKTLGDVRPRFGSIGFCMGGGFSYQLATHSKDLACAAIFYGRTPLDLVPQVSCPLLGSFGALDKGIPPDKVKEFEEALKKVGKPADIKIYDGAGHGFFNDTRPEAYNAEAARDAWQRVLKFFGQYLTEP